MWDSLCFPTLYTVYFPPPFPAEAPLAARPGSSLIGTLAEEMRNRQSVESRLWSQYYNLTHRRLNNPVTVCFIPNIIKDTIKIKTGSICRSLWLQKYTILASFWSIKTVQRELPYLNRLFGSNCLLWSIWAFDAKAFNWTPLWLNQLCCASFVVWDQTGRQDFVIVDMWFYISKAGLPLNPSAGRKKKQSCSKKSV